MRFPAVDDMKVFHVGIGWYRFLGEKKVPAKTEKKRQRRATKPVVVKQADKRRTEKGWKKRIAKERMKWLVRGC